MKLLFAFILAAVFAAILAAPDPEPPKSPAAPSAEKEPAGTPGDCGDKKLAPDTTNLPSSHKLVLQIQNTMQRRDGVTGVKA